MALITFSLVLFSDFRPETRRLGKTSLPLAPVLVWVSGSTCGSPDRSHRTATSIHRCRPSCRPGTSGEEGIAENKCTMKQQLIFTRMFSHID